jgi:hypothetical protein
MKAMKAVVPPGRLDILSHEMLKAGLKANGDPMLRIAEKMMENQIRQALTETLGPGTKAGDFAIKAISAVEEFKRRYLEAQAQIRAEDGD